MTAIPILDKAVTRLMELDQASVFALADIANERLRQIEQEGWSPDHDDRHSPGTMSAAAGCYALYRKNSQEADCEDCESMWPWDIEWWKPGSPNRNQIRAGALLVAELARHLRSAPSQSER